MANQDQKDHNPGPPVENGVPGSRARFFEVASFSQKDKSYLVRQMPGGEWACGCLDFTMNEGKRRKRGESTMCDHCRKVRHLKMKNHGRALTRRIIFKRD